MTPIKPIIFKPNYLFYYMGYTYTDNKDIPDANFANEKYPNGQCRKVKFINLGGTRCFHEKQVVITKNGNKFIKDLTTADSVLSFNHDSKETEYKNVIDVIKNTSNKKKCLKITLKNGKQIKCTDDHQIYLNGRYETAKNVLSLWDNIKTQDNEKNS